MNELFYFRYRYLLLSAMALTSLFTVACSIDNVWLPGHKIPSQIQGNIIERKSIDKLKIGMSREQVQHIMGSPQLRDPFHRERWDYYYLLQQHDKPEIKRHIVLHFDDNYLLRIEPITELDELPDTRTKKPVADGSKPRKGARHSP